MTAYVPATRSLPCGCLLTFAVVDGVNTMTVSPCRLGCRNLASALKMADDAGKPVELRENP